MHVHERGGACIYESMGRRFMYKNPPKNMNAQINRVVSNHLTQLCQCGNQGISKFNLVGCQILPAYQITSIIDFVNKSSQGPLDVYSDVKQLNNIIVHM